MTASTPKALLRALASADRGAIGRTLLDIHLAAMPQSGIANLLVCFLAALALGAKFPGTTLALLLLPAALASLELIRFGRRWRDDHSIANQRLRWQVALRAGMISLSWAILTQYCYVHGDEVLQGLMGMLAAGLMAAAVLACSTVPQAGIAFILIVGGSMLVAQARMNTIDAWFGFGLTCTFMVLLLRSLLTTFGIQLEHLLNE